MISQHVISTHHVVNGSAARGTHGEMNSEIGLANPVKPLGPLVILMIRERCGECKEAYDRSTST